MSISISTTTLRRTVAALISPALRALDRRVDRRVDRRLRATEQELRAELAETRAHVVELTERLHALDLLLGRAGRRAHRQPTPDDIAGLARAVARVTGAAPRDARRATVQAYRTLVEVETRGVGRIAGSTANILGKLTTTPLLAPPGNARVLEIGTLFGLFAGGLARQLLRTGQPCDLTIVDPISAVQLQLGRELKRDLSGTPVTEDVVRANLHAAGVPAERLHLVRGYSTDPAVRKAAAPQPAAFGVIVIDGDHGREGVAADLAWAEEIAAPGAVVVLDDYGDGKWPGVKAAADAHLAGPTRLTLLGQVTTSAFLRAA